MKPQQEHKWKNDCLLQSLSDIANHSGVPIGSEKNTDEVMKHTNAYFSVLSGKIIIFQALFCGLTREGFYPCIKSYVNMFSFSDVWLVS